MKNVMMTLILFVGFVIPHLDAQKCCLPGPICPPGCCKTSCSLGDKSAAASIVQSGEVILASMMLMGDEAKCNLSHKEMKACIAACQSVGQKGPDDNIHTADSSFFGVPNEQAASTNAPSCHPSCVQNPPCKTNPTSSASVEPAGKQTKVREKS